MFVNMSVDGSANVVRCQQACQPCSEVPTLLVISKLVYLDVVDLQCSQLADFVLTMLPGWEPRVLLHVRNEAFTSNLLFLHSSPDLTFTNNRNVLVAGEMNIIRYPISNYRKTINVLYRRLHTQGQKYYYLDHLIEDNNKMLVIIYIFAYYGTEM